jgi:hypothetical protein
MGTLHRGTGILRSNLRGQVQGHPVGQAGGDVPPLDAPKPSGRSRGKRKVNIKLRLSRAQLRKRHVQQMLSTLLAQGCRITIRKR